MGLIKSPTDWSVAVHTKSAQGKSRPGRAVARVALSFLEGRGGGQRKAQVATPPFNPGSWVPVGVKPSGHHSHCPATLASMWQDLATKAQIPLLSIMCQGGARQGLKEKGKWHRMTRGKLGEVVLRSLSWLALVGRMGSASLLGTTSAEALRWRSMFSMSAAQP